MSTLTSAEFQDLADETLEGIHDAVEQALEQGYDGDFDVNLSVSLSTINLMVDCEVCIQTYD
jgi:frataxin-like iron-binding protein CyaY